MTPKRPKKTINKLQMSLEEINEHSLALKEEKKQFVNDVFATYSDEDARNGLIADLERTYYSTKKTNDIKTIFTNYSTDNVDFSAAKNIVEAEQHVSEQTKDEGFFSKIANVFLSEE